jgi:hypothetical protein
MKSALVIVGCCGSLAVYWSTREDEALEQARRARSEQLRSVHLQLAAHYNALAKNVAHLAIKQPGIRPPCHACGESGAR